MVAGWLLFEALVDGLLDSEFHTANRAGRSPPWAGVRSLPAEEGVGGSWRPSDLQAVLDGVDGVDAHSRRLPDPEQGREGDVGTRQGSWVKLDPGRVLNCCLAGPRFAACDQVPLNRYNGFSTQLEKHGTPNRMLIQPRSSDTSMRSKATRLEGHREGSQC